MKTRLWQRWLTSLACAGACIGFLAGSAIADDLRDAAPPGAFMAIYGKHNPERDYQEKHYQAVWDEVQKTKICEKVLQIVQNKMAEGDAAQFVAVREALQNALSPIQWDKLMKTSEVMYAQRFEGPTSLQLVLLRIPDDGAESLKQGIVNLFNLASTASEGKVPVATETVAGVELTYLQLPREVPVKFQPAVGVKGDVIILTTSLELATESLKLLANPSAESKFDDPRVKEALASLPEAEDAIVFFDGKAIAEQLQGIPAFIEMASNGDPNAQRFSDLLSDFMHQMDAIDFEVTVEYTDGFQNRSASFGRMNDTAGDTVLGRMIGKQQTFEDWKSWVPSTTTGFSMTGGGTMLPLYNWAITAIPKAVPEAQQHLDKFAEIQDQFDIHLKEDLLEAFSGETVSVTLPGASTPFGAGAQSVMFTRCSKPDRIQELLHRGLNALNDIPQVKAQGIGLKEVAGLDGFEELTANMLGMAGIRPVIGFRDGWMIIGSHKEAVETALATRSGEAANWSESDRFREFGLDVDGDVHSISYTNTGENIRAMSQGLQQAGMIAPMIIGMIPSQNQGGDGPDLQVLQDILGLLPSVGRIIAKFDFIEASMATAQPGREAGTYVRHSVTLIRPPQEEKPAVSTSPATKSAPPKSAPPKSSPAKSKGK